MEADRVTRSKFACSTLFLAFCLTVLCMSGPSADAQTFTDIGAELAGIQVSVPAWGDYDNDGDLDLAIAGRHENAYVSKIYQNNHGTFTDIGAELVGGTSVSWGDYDNDGDLDLAVIEYYREWTCKIYRNTEGAFSDTGTNLWVNSSHAPAWADYDDDGGLDLTFAGYDGIDIYRNSNGTFTHTSIGIPCNSGASFVWGDYDNDGDLDLALTWSKEDSSSGKYICVATIYRNDNGVFTDIEPGLTAVTGSLAWGDYDNDGDLDLAIAGNDGDYKHFSKIYRNDNGNFIDIRAVVRNIGEGCSLAWGDYDNDGDIDLAIVGYAGGVGIVSKIYRNNNGIFTDIAVGLTAVYYASLAWGDYDNDGDLDLVLAGWTGSNRICKIYRNDSGVLNSVPTAPTGLAASPSGSDITFSWNAATDAQTPVSGLSYNLRVGSAPGKNDIFSGMADSSTGLRRIPSIGNAQKKLSWTLKGLNGKFKDCYWSVQAIDSAFAGSAWASESCVIRPITISGHVKTSQGIPISGINDFQVTI